MTEQGDILPSQSDDFGTPHDLFRALWKKYGPFDLDPCGAIEVHYTAWMVASHGGQVYDGSTPELDGLAQPWPGRVFMNPPYGKAVKFWVAKAADEVESGRASLVVGLLPAHTDTRWFHDHIFDNPRAKVHFLKGRLRFVGGATTARFPSVVVTWKR